MHHCMLNLGLYRTGSTSLAAAASRLGFRVFRSFPDLPSDQLKEILQNPAGAVMHWFDNGGQEELDGLVRTYDFLGDGWISLLCFLPHDRMMELFNRSRASRIQLIFVATQRNETSLIESELHHWVRHDLERKCNLNFKEKASLEHYLRERAKQHSKALMKLPIEVTSLPLEDSSKWPSILQSLFDRHGLVFNGSWKESFDQSGIQNSSPALPTEGILLTLRLDTGSVMDVGQLLDGLKEDAICNFIVVLAIDEDEAGGDFARDLIEKIETYAKVTCITNPPKEPPFPICDVWNRMATKAFELGADWVVLLGDDIKIDCPFHYRAFYRAFLDISVEIGCPFGFGCPWWNDITFPGFPTFPAVGRIHYDIFGSLIPKHRTGKFVNQDLDPYLQRLYLKFGAAPLIEEALLRNGTGGNNNNPTRYDRVSAIGWKHWVSDDVNLIRTFLHKIECLNPRHSECVLLDVIVPTYRIDTEYLKRICGLIVPKRMRTCFAIIVDNPKKLIQMTGANNADEAALQLETTLASETRNNIRVRCNQDNVGASASRNRGLDESAAEYVLFLDDDVIPNSDLLSAYETGIAAIEADKENVIGLVGLVRFPRSAELPILHAAVLMSYLTFMFEIASNPIYEYPAWGVTANILFRRLTLRFDVAYAKTGGGEDVDYCLRAMKSTEGKLKALPEAQVRHDFWPGGLSALLPHFFNWAVGDGALFSRYQQHTYVSWPNIVEFFFLLFVPVWFASWCSGHASIACIPMELLFLLLADVFVETSNKHEYIHRCRLLEHKYPPHFYFIAHLIANVYVAILECGRLFGHYTRGESFQNITRRFDWHCGRLPHAKENFTRREQKKFYCFVSLSIVIIWLV